MLLRQQLLAGIAEPALVTKAGNAYYGSTGVLCSMTCGHLYPMSAAACAAADALLLLLQ
jgi:hypothetical protein